MGDNKIKKETEIPVDGSLGLLAYGDLGLDAWRKKREDVKKKEPKKKEEHKDE